MGNSGRADLHTGRNANKEMEGVKAKCQGEVLLSVMSREMAWLQRMCVLLLP